MWPLGLKIIGLLNEAGLPPGVLQCLPGSGSTAGEALIRMGPLRTAYQREEVEGQLTDAAAMRKMIEEPDGRERLQRAADWMFPLTEDVTTRIAAPASPNRASVAQANAAPEALPLWSALEDVTDPEFPLSAVDMGLVYGLRRAGDSARVQLTFTATGCPCMDFILEDIRARLLRGPDIRAVEIEIVWDPPWTKNRLTEKDRERLRRVGVTI